MTFGFQDHWGAQGETCRLQDYFDPETAFDENVGTVTSIATW